MFWYNSYQIWTLKWFAWTVVDHYLSYVFEPPTHEAKFGPPGPFPKTQHRHVPQYWRHIWRCGSGRNVAGSALTQLMSLESRIEHSEHQFRGCKPANTKMFACCNFHKIKIFTLLIVLLLSVWFVEPLDQSTFDVPLPHDYSQWTKRSTSPEYIKSQTGYIGANETFEPWNKFITWQTNLGDSKFSAFSLTLFWTSLYNHNSFL